MQHVRTLIIGGGLAGSATALHLARQGHAVLVLDRAEFPREKTCGEGLMPHGVDELEALGLLPAILRTGPQPFRGITYRIGDTVAEGRFPGGRMGLGVRRHRIDEVLHHACCEHPLIEVRTGVRVKDVRLDASFVTVDIDSDPEPLRADLVIGADGLQSLVRRKMGLRKESKAAPRYGARMHYQLAPGVQNVSSVHVFIADEIEYYLTPSGPGELNVAILCGKDFTPRFGGDLDNGLRAHLESQAVLKPWLQGATPISKAAMTGPLRQQTRATSAERVLLVGDAAGFVDAITGEGMALSLITARLAAEVASAALADNDLSAQRLRAYDRNRRSHARSLTFFTELVLFGLRHRMLARRLMKHLAKHPETFSTLLGINIGVRPAWRLPARDVVALLTGV